MRWTLVLLLLCGCGGETFKPQSVIEGLRVLAVQAEPAEVGAGETTTLSVLVADPFGDGRPLWRVWLACDPDPLAQFGNRCAQYTAIREPKQLFANPEAATELVRVLGVGAAVQYTGPAGVFDTLPPDHLARSRGLTAVVLLLVTPIVTGNLQDDLRAAAEDKVENELIIKRLKIRDGAERNHNPVLLDVRAEAEHRFRPVVADGATEHYLEIDADGRATPKDEQLVFYWFTTSGRWGHGKTLSLEQAAVFEPPRAGDSPPPPVDGRVPLWVVVRDARGGASWIESSILLP